MFKKLLIAAAMLFLPASAMAQAVCINTKEAVIADGKLHGAEEVFTLSGTDLEVFAAKIAENNRMAAEALLEMDEVKYFKIKKYADTVFVAMFKDNCMQQFGSINVKDYDKMRDVLKGV